MKVNLTNKVALVTGAARGIGKAIADTFVANDAHVIYTDVDLPAVAGAASQAPGAKALQMDVTNPKQIDDVLATILDEFGQLDVLVNNAGVNTDKHRVTMDEFPKDEWDRILNVDLTGVYLVGKAAARVMRKQAAGRIINVASVVGLVPLRLQCPYVAAKAGVINLTRSMAIELGAYGILVNAIAPGSTLTEATKKLFYGPDGQFKNSVQQLLDHIPLGRPAVPEEIAHAALFLAAPESSYINGHTLTVDGGWTAGYMREF